MVLRVMTLEEYLETAGRDRLSKIELAGKLSVSPITVNRWLSGSRFPDKGMILAVEKATGGKVRPADWFVDSASPTRKPRPNREAASAS